MHFFHLMFVHVLVCLLLLAGSGIVHIASCRESVHVLVADCFRPQFVIGGNEVAVAGAVVLWKRVGGGVCDPNGRRLCVGFGPCWLRIKSFQ